MSRRLRIVTRMVMAALSLPSWALRGVVGTPIQVGGGELSPTAQLLIKLERLVPTRPAHLVPITDARREFDVLSTTLLAGVARDVEVRETLVDGGADSLPARIYTPPGTTGPLPSLVYLHGGGFVLGSLASHDGICRFLSLHGGVRIISVDYRLAPENPYPAAVEDALAAFRHVASNPADFGVSAGMVGIGGDSAGATLAAVVAARCADGGAVTPAFNLMIIPPVDAVGGHPSRQLFGHGYLIDSDTITWYRSRYLPDLSLVTEPDVSPLRAKDFGRLPPTCVVTCGFDPFRDEGVEYSDKLRAAGVSVTHLHHDGLLHGFPAFVACDEHARKAMYEIAAELRHMAISCIPV